MLTISLVSLSIVKRWWQQNCALSSQQMVKRFSEKKNNLVLLQHIARAWYSLEYFLVLTCYSKVLRKNKWMITWFDLQLPWLKAKYVISATVSLYVFPRTNLHKENKRSLFGISYVLVTYKYEWSIVDNESCSGKSSHIYLRGEKRNSFF